MTWKMSEELLNLDLRSEGARELIRLTNSQFNHWGETLKREAKMKDLPGGNMMNCWFILSELAQQRDPEFQMNKSDAFDSVPNLKRETVRKQVTAAEKLGFVETVKSRGNIYLRLTPEGQRAVASTLSRWIVEFSRIQREHFVQNS
jgi:hypothetical protein